MTQVEGVWYKVEEPAGPKVEDMTPLEALEFVEQYDGSVGFATEYEHALRVLRESIEAGTKAPIGSKMLAPKHTPGPWVAERRNGWHDIVSEAEPTHVARVHDVMEGDGGYSNAALIAAVPDLLEALEKVTARLKRYIHADSYHPEDFQAVQEANAALAKSKGGK